MEPAAIALGGIFFLFILAGSNEVDEHNQRVDRCHVLQDTQGIEPDVKVVKLKEDVVVNISINECPDKRDFGTEMGEAFLEGAGQGVGRALGEVIARGLFGR